MNDKNGPLNEHWLALGLRGVNVVTVILAVLAGAALYFQLDKDLALLKRDTKQIERELGDVKATLASIQDELRRGVAADRRWSPSTDITKGER